MSSTEKMLNDMYYEKFNEFVVWPFGGNYHERKRIEMLKQALIEDKPIDLDEIQTEGVITE